MNIRLGDTLDIVKDNYYYPVKIIKIDRYKYGGIHKIRKFTGLRYDNDKLVTFQRKHISSEPVYKCQIQQYNKDKINEYYEYYKSLSNNDFEKKQQEYVLNKKNLYDAIIELSDKYNIKIKTIKTYLCDYYKVQYFNHLFDQYNKRIFYKTIENHIKSSLCTF